MSHLFKIDLYLITYLRIPYLLNILIHLTTPNRHISRMLDKNILHRIKMTTYVNRLQATKNHHLHYFDQLSLSQKVFSMSNTNYTEPRTYKEACQHDYWLKVMKTKLDALASNNTFQLVEKLPHVKLICNKWVYKVKHKDDGST